MLIWKNKRGSNRSDEDVKRRSRFESRRFRRYEADDDGKDSKTIETPDYFGDDNMSYDEFVDSLKLSLDDPKAKAWIDYAFGDKNGDISFTASSQTPIDVSKLYPTQNFIGFENSIGFSVKNPGKAQASLTKMLSEESPSVLVGSPVWVFESESKYFIIDGHHRWSQVYAFNPKAKIQAIVFKASVKLEPKQALAAVQGVIASVLDKLPVSTSKVDGSSERAVNVLEASDTEMNQAAVKMLSSDKGASAFELVIEDIFGDVKLEADESGTPLDIIKRTTDLPGTYSKEIQEKYPYATRVLFRCVQNCTSLKAHNNCASGSPDREYMPQTDGGKGASKDTPNKVMQTLQTGVDDVVKQVERRGIPRAIHKKYID